MRLGRLPKQGRPTVPKLPSAAAVQREILKALQESLGLAKRSAEASASDATHAEARAENDKDTRSLETSYLARGQAMRVAELEADIKTIKFLVNKDSRANTIVQAGSVVAVEDEEGAQRLVFLAGAAGGLKVRVQGVEVQVITPSSPLGRLLLGKEEGDAFELRAPKGMQELWVVAVGR